MRKFLIFTIFSLVVLCGVYIAGLLDMVYRYVNHMEPLPYIAEAAEPIDFDDRENLLQLTSDNYILLSAVSEVSLFEVYINEIYDGSFTKYENALFYCEDKEFAAIMDSSSRMWIWDNYPEYTVLTENNHVEFYNFAEAVRYARSLESHSQIVYRKDRMVIWEKEYAPQGNFIENVPLILQHPELPRGCEVTSLAMLLNYAGVSVDKMALADQIKKDMTPKTDTHGPNPNVGFVGNMYDMSQFGLGVYEAPVYELMKEYLPYSSLNLTGCDIGDLYYLLDHGAPVWVIITSTYGILPPASFEQWHTVAGGTVDITYSMHAVVVTGYDNDYIYLKDPYGYTSKTNKQQFIASWEQMGRQALSVTPR